jgi:hypothetical protein
MSDSIDRLEIEVQAQAQKANAELDKMANRLEKVANSLTKINGSGIKGFANGIQSLSDAVQGMSNNTKTADFTRISKNIEKLGNIDQSKINATASAIRTISNSLTASTGLSTGAMQVTELANSISKLGYKSASNAVTNIPLMASALRGLMQTLSTSPQVSRNLISMTNSLANLAQQGSKVRTATNSINSSLKRYSGTTRQAEINTKAFAVSLAGLYAKLWAVRRAVTGMWGSVEKSMDYGETINLFQTSFKKIGVDTAEDLGAEMGSVASEQFGKAFIDRAQSFNDRITNALSLDPELMMKYQAVFAQMSNSMNLTAASALNISETLTLLGNDIASLWNIDTDIAMKKLQSGLAGQIRPLRELGVDISQTSLEMTALNYGIEDNIKDMSQAAKVQLRWLAIMNQTEVAFGDMAKTIDSPANQLRVLQQQWTNLSRSIGNVFLPVITTVLPYINAVVIAVRRLVDTFATAVGFELPDYSDSNIYTDITGDIEGIGDEADSATDMVDGLKKSLMGFDELNILSERKGKKGINLDVGGGYGELDDAIQQKTTSYMKKFNEELANMKNKAEELADKIQPKLQKFIEYMDKLEPLLKGIGAAFVTYKVVDWFSKLSGSLGSLNPTAGVVALAVLAIVAIYNAVKEYNKKLMEEDLASRFGEIKLSMEEIEKVAERLTSSNYTANIDIYVSEKLELDKIEKNIKSDIETLNKLNWKVSVGLVLTEGEVEQYKSTIESFIANSEAYIEQQHYVTKLAINAVIIDDNFNAEITKLVDEYFNGSKGEMTRLGKSLRSEMDNALADGIIDATEQKTIDNLIKEIGEINNKVADAEFKATLQMITIDGDLTADSFKELTEKIQEAIQGRIEKAEQASYTALASVNAAYAMKIENATTATEKKAIQKEWDSAVKEITENLSQTKAEISFDGTQFSLDSLIDKYGIEMDRVSVDIQTKTKNTFTEEVILGLTNTDPSEGIKALVDGLSWNYLTALDEAGLDKATKDGLAEMLKALEPSEEQFKKVYDDALETGSKVPEGISAQLTDIANLQALTGDRDAILYLIGQQMAESPEYLNMISAAETAGKDLDDSIIAGLKSKIPDLEKQGDSLIFDLDKAIKSASTDSGKNNMPSHANKMIKGLKGAFDTDTTAISSVRSWLQGINDLVNSWKVPQVSIPVPSFNDMQGQLESTPIWKLNLKGYAGGGQPNTGEIFASRENGIPELVGRIGTKTTVANNDQITDGISSAVERAMTKVLIPALSGIGNTNTKIVLEGDAKGVFKLVRQENQSHFKRTGKNGLVI